MNLSGVEAGEYELLCLPIKIRGGDGAPARVLLGRRGVAVGGGGGDMLV